MFALNCLLILASSIHLTLSLAPSSFNHIEPVQALRQKLIEDTNVPKRTDADKCRSISSQDCRNLVDSLGRQLAERRLNPSIGDNIRVIVLLIKFSDHTTRDLPSREYFEEFFNGEGSELGSVKEWMRFNSVGRYRVHFTVREWATLPNTEKFYAAGNSAWNTDFNPVVAPLLDEIDNDPNHKWSPDYIDEFGKLNHLIVVHSGYMAEVGDLKCLASNPNKADRIWSSGGNGEGTGAPDAWRSKDFYEVGGMALLSAFSIPSCDKSGAFQVEPAALGPFVHEFSHGFGLPDLYDLNVPPLGGIGKFSNMASSQGWDFSPKTPGHMDGWSRARIGWVDYIDIEFDGYYAIQPLEVSGQVYRITKGYPEGEYLVIENKQPIKYDSDMPAGTGGIVIFHVDEKADRQKNAGFPGKSGWPADHYRVAVQQADGNYDIEKGVNLGDEGDFYRKGSKLSSGGDFPNTDSYQGGVIKSTGIKIEVVTDSQFIMAFHVTGLGQRTLDMQASSVGSTEGDVEGKPFLREGTPRATVAWILGMFMSVSLMLGMLLLFL
ncbi:hypothetical protein FisN_13Lh199 [Fistulifera solaris]|uniref:Peptidase M6-like domain-containing protein n=1 Tax=Fistulifera solaris TaxID=1519565 RepID=A0A1Z5KLP8_FISSO|nr:hypothetical protein FisN_13Lh199 [Fistulifera solaris]|eukprot:GAX27244.1 hypothetical protein FisN_13Lh199 [Fistulifera solaris]